MRVSGKRMHKGDRSGAASSSSEEVTPLTYIFCFDPEEAIPIMLATVAPVAVVALDSNHPAPRICEMLVELFDDVWRSAFRQIMDASLLRTIHYTRSHLGVIHSGWRYGRDGWG